MTEEIKFGETLLDNYFYRYLVQEKINEKDDERLKYEE